jgi:arginase
MSGGANVDGYHADRVALIGMRCRTVERTPAAAGLEELCRVMGERLDVAPRLIGSPVAGDSTHDRDFAQDMAASRGCLLEAGGQVEDALARGAMPVMVAGDGAIALSTLPTVARLRPQTRILWLDAHAAFHTPQSSPNVALEATALAGACGRWSTGFDGVVPCERVILCGARDIDDDERELLESASITIIGTALETLVYLQNALDGASTYVHLDVDVLDESVMPVSHAAPDGLGDEKLFDLLDAVADSCEVVGIEITGFEAQSDADETVSRAEVITGVLDPLLPIPSSEEPLA